MRLQATILWVAALLLIAAGVYWYTREVAPSSEPIVPVAEELATTVEEEPALPQFPLAPPSVSRSEPQDLTPLPALGESDAYFEMEMVELFGNGVADLLVDTALIEKIVTTVDNLPRPQVAEKVRPVGPLVGAFAADGQDDSGEFTLNTGNYERYGFLTNLLASSDTEILVSSYRRFYPLFQEAYVNLGYPNGHFNDRAVEVIEHLLETPDVDEPIALVRPHVLYEFADPDLEALSSGQKLLIRAGADNRVRILQFLEELRDAITVDGARP